MALGEPSRAILVWIAPTVAGGAIGGLIGHAKEGDIFGWKAGLGLGVVAGLVTAVGLNAIVPSEPATPQNTLAMRVSAYSAADQRRYG